MLTSRQQQVLNFIGSFREQRGFAPSTREIQRHFGFASQTGAMRHIRALKRKRVLSGEHGKARALVVPASTNVRMLRIPIYGSIPAGSPTSETQREEGCVVVDMETLRLPKGACVFALRARGDSMTGAGILDGDVVILEHREARSGEIVAALLDGESTLKRFVTQRGRSFLKAENPEYPNLIPAQELLIQGVQVGLLRTTK